MVFQKSKDGNKGKEKEQESLEYGLRREGRS